MAKTSKKALLLDREARAWSLRCHGWTQERIAAELQVDQGTVSRIIARVWDRVRAQHEAEIALQRSVALGQVEHQYDEAMQAWERSKLPKKRASQRTSTSDQDLDQVKVQTVESADQTGDTSYYYAALQAWDRRNKLLGLDAPAKLPVEDDSQPGSVASIASTLIAAEREFTDGALAPALAPKEPTE